MDVVNRQFEEYLLEEVESGAVWPISDEFIQTHTSPLLAIVHNGSYGRFDGSSSISFWCRRTRRVVTLVETVPTWHLEDEFDMKPSDLMKRMAVRFMRELTWGMSTRQTISPALAIQIQSEYPLPNSQETIVDSMSDYVMISLEDSPYDFEDVIHDNGDPGEIEAILDESLLARAQEWANTEIEEEQAM